MKNNVTYYLGAGASANCIPVMNKLFKDGFAHLIDFFNDYGNSYLQGIKDIRLHNARKRFIDNNKKLLLELRKHPTVDIYAKKLYLQNKSNELNQLKRTVILTFIFLQLTIKYDERYDKFFASILNYIHDEAKLPDNVNIITWNYDIQLELSLLSFYGSAVNMQKMFGFYNMVYSSSVENSFKIIRLNGVAGVIEKNRGLLDVLNTGFNSLRHSDLPMSEDKFHILDILFNLYVKYLNQYLEDFYHIDETFTYCWEGTNFAKSNLESARQIAKNTDILVIIGYSFPYVNKIYDQSIIKSMKSLKKVYIQDPNVDESMISYLKDRFNDFKDSDGNKPEVVPITQKNEFYIPNEL